jgi:NADPH:quinone reductase-like Zn-dependent oxidoreductase
MNAAPFHAHDGPEDLRLDDIAAPVSKPGEALIRVRTAGVEYADTHQRNSVTPLTI